MASLLRSLPMLPISPSVVGISYRLWSISQRGNPVLPSSVISPVCGARGWEGLALRGQIVLTQGTHGCYKHDIIFLPVQVPLP